MKHRFYSLINFFNSAPCPVNIGFVPTLTNSLPGIDRCICFLQFSVLNPSVQVPFESKEGNFTREEQIARLVFLYSKSVQYLCDVASVDHFAVTVETNRGEIGNGYLRCAVSMLIFTGGFESIRFEEEGRKPAPAV